MMMKLNPRSFIQVYIVNVLLLLAAVCTGAQDLPMYEGNGRLKILMNVNSDTANSTHCKTNTTATLFLEKHFEWCTQTSGGMGFKDILKRVDPKDLMEYDGGRKLRGFQEDVVEAQKERNLNVYEACKDHYGENDCRTKTNYDLCCYYSDFCTDNCGSRCSCNRRRQLKESEEKKKFNAGYSKKISAACTNHFKKTAMKEMNEKFVDVEKTCLGTDPKEINIKVEAYIDE